MTNYYTMTVKPYPSIAASKDIQLDRSVLPPLGAAPEINFPQVQKQTLKNGLNVLLLERHSAPIVNLTLALDAGYAADLPGKAGLASLALGLMEEGTKTKDAFQLQNELDMLGSVLSTSSTLDMSFVKIEATSETLRPSVKILSDVVLNASFPEDKFKIQKEARLAQIAQGKAQPTSMALRVLPSLLYGNNHAYGKPMGGSGYEKSVAALQRTDLIAWHSQWFKPGSATLVVTGDITMQKLMPLLEEAFGAWKPGKAPVKELNTVAHTKGGKIYLINKPDAPQSIIVASHI
jgi:zinc protease